MEDDLSNSPFFDGRTLGFIGKVLSGARVNPLNAREQKLALQAVRLRELNEALEGQLISLLRGYSGYISVPVGVNFLLEAHRRNELETAKDILYLAERDEYGADLETLLDILEEAKTAPAGLVVLMKARHIYNRHEPLPTENLSQLNLKAMRDFK